MAAFGGGLRKCLPVLCSKWQLCAQAPASASLSNVYLVEPSDPSKAILQCTGTLRENLRRCDSKAQRYWIGVQAPASSASIQDMSQQPPAGAQELLSASEVEDALAAEGTDAIVASRRLLTDG